MNPLMLTISFLTLISILTSSELGQHGRQQFCCDLICKATIHENTQSSSIQKALLEDLVDEQLPKNPQQNPSPVKRQKTSQAKPRKTSKSLRYNTSRPPNNSRLNFFLILQEEDAFWMQGAALLMRQLYQDYDFFNQVPHAEDRILAALIHQKSCAQAFEYPDDLATLDLGDEVLQGIFYHMLKGDLAPSLLNFITYDNPTTPNQKKLNLLFAPSQLLCVFFPQQHGQLEHLIHEIWQDIITSEQSQDPEQRIGRVAIRQNLLTRFEQMCTDTAAVSQAKEYFDFTLGKPGNILLLEDPQSGAMTRSKIPARHKST